MYQVAVVALHGDNQTINYDHQVRVEASTSNDSAGDGRHWRPVRSGRWSRASGGASFGRSLRSNDPVLSETVKPVSNCDPRLCAQARNYPRFVGYRNGGVRES